MKIEVNCDYCGKVIGRHDWNLKRSQYHFCNDSCKGKWQSLNVVGSNAPNWKGGKIKVKCNYCGKQEERYFSGVKRSKYYFCNVECLNKWRGGKVKVNCNNCGKLIKRYPSLIKGSNKHFCNELCYGKWLSESVVGSNNHWWKGGKVKVKCGYCGKIKKVHPCRVASRDEHFCNSKCMGKWMKETGAVRGENAPWWKGGITPENARIRHSDAYKEWRLMVFGRDNYTCQLCLERGGYLNAHHIRRFSDYPELRFAVFNGITLCEECHNKVKNREEEHIEQFESLLQK